METIYVSLRQELLAADALLYWITLIVFLSLLVGTFICEAATSLQQRLSFRSPDIFLFISIVAVTGFILRGPTHAYFEERRWRCPVV